MSRFDERGISEAVRVASEDAVDIGGETDAVSTELPSEYGRNGIARADGESERGVGHHLSVEERYLSVRKRVGDGVRRESADPGIALDDDGSGMHRNDRQSGGDAYLCN